MAYELKKREKELLINLTATEHEPALRAIISEAGRLHEENERLKRQVKQLQDRLARSSEAKNTHA